MNELSLADCYGHAGLSAENDKISLRIDPVKAISDNLTRKQVLDLVRLYFGLPVLADMSWFTEPIISADVSFSMIANERELSIIAMALLAQDIGVEQDGITAQAVLVAHACGKRKPIVYPQFVEMVKAAAKDLTITERHANDLNQTIKARALKKDLGASETDLVPQNDFATMNEVLKKLNIDSHDMNKFLATQLNSALKPIRSELVNLREEKDMLWWLIGGQSTQLEEPYCDMNEARAAFLIGSELADLCRTPLGPSASGFLLRKALHEGRTDKMSKVKIGDLPKLFAIDDLRIISNITTIDQVRDLCFFNNALARANDMASTTAWKNKYIEDGSLSEKTQFAPSELAMQSFRETLLLNSLTA